MIDTIKQDIQSFSNPQKAEILQRFFKTGKGQYGEGDVFLGIVVPISRKIAKKYKEISLHNIEMLLHSQFHEERLIALFILIEQYKKTKEGKEQKAIYEFYLHNTKYINNWDLVDLSAGYIVGKYLTDKPRSILKNLAHSDILWEKRIAIISTFYFIKEQHEYDDTFAIAEILLKDTHDLIHKAVGWMLREVGKRISREKEQEFLQKHYKLMPRTMLRYAIEHFPQSLREKYLTGKV